MEYEPGQQPAADDDTRTAHGPTPGLPGPSLLGVRSRVGGLPPTWADNDRVVIWTDEACRHCAETDEGWICQANLGGACPRGPFDLIAALESWSCGARGAWENHAPG